MATSNPLASAPLSLASSEVATSHPVFATNVAASGRGTVQPTPDLDRIKEGTASLLMLSLTHRKV
ncbi:hypothetical protein [Rothia sp. 88186D007BW]